MQVPQLGHWQLGVLEQGLQAPLQAPRAAAPLQSRVRCRWWQRA